MELDETKEKLYDQVQKNEHLICLRTYSKEWIYNALSGICKSDKREPTFENMILYAGMLDSDLESMFPGNRW